MPPSQCLSRLLGLNCQKEKRKARSRWKPASLHLERLDDLLVAAVAAIDGGGGNVRLLAGDDQSIEPTATVRTSGAGTIHLEVDVDNADPGTGGTATFSGASVDAPAGAVVKGNDDDDVFQFSPSPTTDIDVQAGAGVNTLLVDDSASLVADSVDLTAAAITGSGFLITYSAVGGSFGLVSYTAGQGDDTIRVLSKGGDQVIVNGSGGNDLFLVVVTKTQPPTGIEVDGEAGFDRLRTQDNSGGAIIRNRKTGPGQGIIQVSYARQPISAYLYRNIEQVLGINLASNYIQALHHHIFGRDASAAEVAHWTAVLNRRGRLAVVRALEYAAEGRTFLVHKWFQIFLGRTPTAAQAAPFVRALLAGQSEEVVLGRLLGNPRAPYRPAVRRRLVRFYFQDLLRRNPTPRELAFWVNSNFRLQAIRQLIEVSRNCWRIVFAIAVST